MLRGIKVQSARGLLVAAGLLWALPCAAALSGEPDLSSRYAPAAQRIREAVEAGNDGYRKLEELCDDVGHRLSGSVGLERAVQWCLETMRKDGQENVRSQPVTVTKWVRGVESLRMVAPQEMDLPMLGLGGSVATPAEGITAEVLSVGSLEELTERSAEARGKIVLFDVPMPSDNEESGAGYGTAVRFRGAGARWASEHGAAACLVRSVTTRSFQSPHTGAMGYFEAKSRIPAAAITTEHAAMITRLQKRGIAVRVTLKMQAKTEGSAPSANVLGELRGSELPDEIVVIGGHLDSWDVGQGAQDDGGGCVVAMEAINVLRKLNLRPRRTIRVVLWTNEENGLAGGKQYAFDNAAEMPRHVAAIECDGGVAAWRGFSVESRDEAVQDRAAEQIRDILKLLEPIREGLVRTGGSGADIGPMKEHGVTLMGQMADMTHYFDIHHTHADTIDKVNPRQLNEHIAAMAIMAYVIADMPGRLGSQTETTTH